MLMDVLLASTAAFRTASAMSSCRGMLSGRRMSEILPCSGRDMVQSWDYFWVLQSWVFTELERIEMVELLHCPK